MVRYVADGTTTAVAVETWGVGWRLEAGCEGYGAVVLRAGGVVGWCLWFEEVVLVICRGVEGCAKRVWTWGPYLGDIGGC